MRCTKGIVAYRRVSPAAGFNPETNISWHSLFWAEGSSFEALGLANGDPVSTWPNEAGEVDLTQTGTARPILETPGSAKLNSKPCIKFDGTNDYLITTTFGTNPTYPISIVMIISDWDLNRGLLDGLTASNRNVIFESLDKFSIFAGTTQRAAININTNAHAMLAVFDGGVGNDKLFVNGSSRIDANAGSQTLTGITLGQNFALSDGWFGGRIAFLGIYEGVINVDEPLWADFVTWVNDHYGLTIG